MPKETITTSEESAVTQAKAQLASIKELMNNHRRIENDSFNDKQEDDMANISEAIRQHALEICVRSGWQPVGNADAPEIDEYYILLCTGGPAVRIRGNLNIWNEPDDAILEYQDWGTPWTEYAIAEEDERDLLEYVKQLELDYIV